MFYGRDRGDAGTQPVILPMKEWMSTAYISCIEYYYLFSGGQWWVYSFIEQNGWQNVKSFFPQYILTNEEMTCNI